MEANLQPGRVDSSSMANLKDVTNASTVKGLAAAEFAPTWPQHQDCRCKVMQDLGGAEQGAEGRALPTWLTKPWMWPPWVWRWWRANGTQETFPRNVGFAFRFFDVTPVTHTISNMHVLLHNWLPIQEPSCNKTWLCKVCHKQVFDSNL